MSNQYRIPVKLVPYRPLLGNGLRLLLLGSRLVHDEDEGPTIRVRLSLSGEEIKTLETLEAFATDRHKRTRLICDALRAARESKLLPCPTEGKCRVRDCPNRTAECDA